MKLTKKILEDLILEVLEEQPEPEPQDPDPVPEPEDEIDYAEDYENALNKIEDCEKRVEYLTKRLKKCQEKTNTSRGNWSDLWENN